ncbi:MAG: hypothetical protein DRG34_04795 [Deltaproteobacteria bacterium]|nr:MAG: hypothetical protein DRG34_04795 [Deltaproteobacteria bacterium]
MKINQEFPRFFAIRNPKSEIQNLKSHFTIIFLDEVVGCIIVSFHSELGPRDRKEFPHGL